MGDENELINQDEIERLLASSAAGAAQSGGGPPGVAPAATPSSEPGAPAAAGSAATPPPTAAATTTAAPSPGPTQTTEARTAMDQDEVNRLFGQIGGGSATSPSPPVQKGIAQTASQANDSGIAQSDIELLLRQAEQALASIAQEPTKPVPEGVTPFQWEEFSGAPPNTEAATLDLIRDVELDLRIELGRTQMYLEDVLKLRRGSVVTLDKLAGDPVDIFVNGRLIARGEVLVLNDNFCVRVAELVAGVSPA